MSLSMSTGIDTAAVMI